jgi:methionine-rich copper-binding protein CopC
MTAPASSRRRVALVACAVLAVLGMALLWRSPATTGSPPRLKASNPADRRTLAQAPDSVDLTFNARPVAELSHVSVVDAAGRATAAGPVRAVGDGLRMPVRITGAGAYTLAYHATFSDGAELTGEVHFGVGTAPGAESKPGGDSAEAAGHEHGVDPVSAVLLLADAVTLLGAVSLLLFRRPRQYGATDR